VSASDRPAALTSATRALDLLSSGELELLGLMPDASNYTFLAEVSDGGGSALAVYKPRRGEMPLWDFPDGTLCRREVAAYELSAGLGWPAVPPTVLREGPHGIGSVQLFVEANPNEHFFTLRESRLHDFLPVALFDAVANNADRKGGHCLLGTDGTIWAVDHGVCFGVEPKLRTVIWEFAGERIPAPLLADISRVTGELSTGILGDRLADLLAPEEVEALAARGGTLARSGCFPLPSSERPYPWPPV
jgi:hypothetical protein